MLKIFHQEIKPIRPLNFTNSIGRPELIIKGLLNLQ
jgi:hypothetical protein